MLYHFITSQTLPPLLPNYKNPCWEEDLPNDFTYDDSFFNTCHYIPHTNKLKHGAQYKNFERILQSRWDQTLDIKRVVVSGLAGEWGGGVHQ